MTGDIHDHRTNFKKLIAAADLAKQPAAASDSARADPRRSLRLERRGRQLEDALPGCGIEIEFPSQVHFLLANHDLAQIHGEGIMKAGLSVCEAFTKG